MGIRVNAFKIYTHVFYFLIIVFHLVPSPSLGGFPDGSAGKESACDAGDPGSIPGWEDPLEKGMALPIFLPREFHGQRSPAGCSQWGHKELDTSERLTHNTHIA